MSDKNEQNANNNSIPDQHPTQSGNNQSPKQPSVPTKFEDNRALKTGGIPPGKK